MELIGWSKDREVDSSPLGIAIALWVFDHVGPAAYKALLSFIVTFYWFGAKKARGYSAEYLRLLRSYMDEQEKAGTLPPDAYRGSLNTYLHIRNYGMCIMEKILSWNGRIGICNIVSRDNAHERMLEAAKHGAFIIGSHIGNIEMLRAVNDHLTRKTVNVMMVTSAYKKFAGFLKNVNSDYGLNIIKVDDFCMGTDGGNGRESSLAAAFEIGIELRERIERGEWVVILGDRVLDGDTEYVEVPLLGKPAHFPVGPWVLAAAVQAPCYLLHSVHENGQPVMYFREMGEVRLDRRNRMESIRKYAEIYASELENILMRSPLDWGNFYDYWAI